MKEPRKLGLLERKRYERRIRRRKARIKTTIVLMLVAVVLVFTCVKWKPWEKISFGSSVETDGDNKNNKNNKDDKENIRQTTMDEAERMAASYGYDEAIEMLKEIEGWKEDEEIQSMISDIKAEKATCVPVKIDEVTHIFYRSLIVDEKRAFGNQDRDSQAAANNQWMTTVDEFNAITQAMYDRGYVMVSIHDLYEVTTDEDGEEVWQPAEILLPPDKKAFVLSLDDLSYYHSYDNYGHATKFIIDDNGDVMNEYIDAEGNTLIGAYDCVPLMDQFVEEHPDASYKGAKGMIALTGYNGVLGYRTDVTYDLDHPNCDSQQRAWIETHPDFDLETERSEAKKVADAMKANGWEFASHTWGNIKVGDKNLSSIKTDTEKWKENVEPIVGETDIIVFAHGQDLEDVGAYSKTNEKYQYFRSEGYRIFCNVDSHQYSTYLGSDYMRQGRRNIDGYRIYYNANGSQNNLSDLFDASEVLDPDRPPVPEV